MSTSRSCSGCGSIIPDTVPHNVLVFGIPLKKAAADEDDGKLGREAVKRQRWEVD